MKSFTMNSKQSECKKSPNYHRYSLWKLTANYSSFLLSRSLSLPPSLMHYLNYRNGTLSFSSLSLFIKFCDNSFCKLFIHRFWCALRFRTSERPREWSNENGFLIFLSSTFSSRLTILFLISSCFPDCQWECSCERGQANCRVFGEILRFHSSWPSKRSSDAIWHRWEGLYWIGSGQVILYDPRFPDCGSCEFVQIFGR